MGLVFCDRQGNWRNIIIGGPGKFGFFIEGFCQRQIIQIAFRCGHDKSGFHCKLKLSKLGWKVGGTGEVIEFEAEAWMEDAQGGMKDVTSVRGEYDFNGRGNYRGWMEQLAYPPGTAAIDMDGLEDVHHCKQEFAT